MIVKLVWKEVAINQERLVGELKVLFSIINRWKNGKVKPSYMALEVFNEFCKILCWKGI